MLLLHAQTMGLLNTQDSQVIQVTLDMLSRRVYRGEREVASERFTSREARRYRRRMKKNRMMNGTNAGMIHGTTRHTRIRDPASRSCTFNDEFQ